MKTVEAIGQDSQIVLYNPDETISLAVKIDAENDTVWLTQAQMMELFQTSKQNVSLHINNIFKEGELLPELVVKESLTTTPHGAISGKMQHKKVKLYNLDVIISLGYRVKSLRGTQFRKWRKESHERWLIIDECLYHCGHSLNATGGRKISAITLMGTRPETILAEIQ